MYAFPAADRHETPLGKPFAVLVETMTTLVNRRKFVTNWSQNPPKVPRGHPRIGIGRPSPESRADATGYQSVTTSLSRSIMAQVLIREFLSNIMVVIGRYLFVYAIEGTADSP